MNIERQIKQDIKTDFFKKKVIVLLGARQVGKSTLIKELMKNESNTLFFDGENADTHILLANASEEKLRTLIGKSQFVIIDEAQKIANIGSVLKIFADYFPNVQVIASGSSAFELKNKLNEPLTGRRFDYQLFPLSFEEMAKENGLISEIGKLHHRLIYGYYPDVVINFNDEERILKFLSDSYLYKDIFLFKGIKKPEKMMELLKALAWQIGNEVNYNELGRLIGLDNQTVEDYIHLLEQAFVIYRLNAYHTNQRKELKKAKKIYFNDVGIRNAIINDFRPVELRSDKGNLFENFMVNEFRKQNQYKRIYANLFFWRTTEQKEIDLIIEKNGFLKVFEIKWSAEKKVKLTKSFSNVYSNFEFNLVNTQNFYEFITE